MRARAVSLTWLRRELNGLEDCEGAGIDMDDVFSDAADGSGPADRTLVHAPIYCAGLRPAVREPVLHHYPSTLHGIGNQGVSSEARINLNRVSLQAVPTASRGILSPGCAETVEQPGGTCAPCLDIEGTKLTGVRPLWVTQWEKRQIQLEKTQVGRQRQPHEI